MREWRADIEQRLRGAGLDGATEQDIVDELAQHLQDRYEELRGRGIEPEAARAQALAELDDDEPLGQRVGRIIRARPEPLPLGRAPAGVVLGGWLSDVRFGARMLARAPLYAAIAVLVIAFGIGANTVIFTAINTVLLRPPSGVVDADELAVVFTSDFSGPLYGGSSYPDYEAIRDERVIFESVTAYTAQTFSVTGDDWTARGMGEIVSANYFAVLGVSPAAGRFFSAEEGDTRQTSSVVVISHELWENRFGRSRNAIGSTVMIAGEPFTVIGVTPRDFGGSLRGLRMQLWLPLSAPRTVTGVDPTHRGSRSMMIVGRRGEGVTLAMVEARLKVVAARLHGAYPELWTDINERPRVFTAVPEAEARVPRQARGAIVGFMTLLMGAVLTVLLIACTNVANLMLSRATARRTEMGIRIALGATRGRIVRHLLAESLVLAVLGGTAGILVAIWLTRLPRVLQGVLPMPITIDLPFDWRVLTFASVITLLTGVLFGLAPALQASRAPLPMLKDDARAGVRLRLRHALVVFQVAASLVLLIAGSLFLRSLRAAQRIDTGFDVDNIVVARFELGSEGYTDEQSARFYDELLQRVNGFSAVTASTLAETVPLGMGSSRRSISVAGYEPQPGENMEFMYNGVSPGYFATMGLKLRRGREFTAADRAGAPPVAIVTEAFARRFWPGEDPIGKRVGYEGPEGTFMDVIGVAPDAKYRSMVEEPQPYVYYPYAQRPSAHMNLLVRTAAHPDVVIGAVRDAVQELAPALPPATIHTFRQHLSLAALPQRIAATLLSGMGVFAIAIAAIGLYGLVAFGVAQRAREFGIRMALGALASDVRRLVLGHALRLVVIGIVCGVPIAVAVAFLIRSFLVVQPFDPIAFVGVPVLLAAAALLASYAPARRATRADPAAALRAE